MLSPMCLTPFRFSLAKYDNQYAQVPQAQQMAFSPFTCQLDQPRRNEIPAVQMHFAYLGKVLQLFQNYKLGPCHPDTHSHSRSWKTSAQTTIFSPHLIKFFGSYLSITVKQAGNSWLFNADNRQWPSLILYNSFCGINRTALVVLTFVLVALYLFLSN